MKAWIKSAQEVLHKVEVESDGEWRNVEAMKMVGERANHSEEGVQLGKEPCINQNAPVFAVLQTYPLPADSIFSLYVKDVIVFSVKCHFLFQEPLILLCILLACVPDVQGLFLPAVQRLAVVKKRGSSCSS